MTIKLNNEEAFIVKESLELEKEIMSLSLKEYAREEKAFEKKHKMKTKKFLDKYNSGDLEDDEEWFDWLFAYKAGYHIKERLKAIESIAV